MNKEYKYFKLHDELMELLEGIKPYYDVNKIKRDSVYIWTKGDWDKGDFGENVFDITTDGIYYYVEDHVIPEEVMPIIEKIQHKLKEMYTILVKECD